MSEWLKLDPQQLRASGTHTKRDADVEITVSMSPYDVPEAVRGYFAQALKKFLIEFHYVQDEPLRSVTPDPEHPEVSLRVGRRTGRLYGIEIDVVALNAHSVRLNVSTVASALDRFARNTRQHKPDNLAVAKAVLDEFGDRLLPAAP